MKLNQDIVPVFDACWACFEQEPEAVAAEEEEVADSVISGAGLRQRKKFLEPNAMSFSS